MVIVVGENSYITLLEADAIVENNFISSNSNRVYWNNLSNDDKNIILVKATKIFDNDSLFYYGKKVEPNQKMQFPRLCNGYTVQCPDDIKTAICVQMINNLDTSVNNFKKLSDAGITSYKESDGASVSLDNTTAKKNKICGINRDIFIDYVSRYSLLTF